MASTLLAALLPYLINAFTRKKTSKKNAVNELLTLFSCYAFITFNIVTVEVNFTLGYFTIGILGSYILLTVIKVVWKTIKSVRKNLRNCCVMRAYRKKRTNLQRYLKQHHEERIEHLRKVVRPERRDDSEILFDVSMSSSESGSGSSDGDVSLDNIT